MKALRLFVLIVFIQLPFSILSQENYNFTSKFLNLDKDSEDSLNNDSSGTYRILGFYKQFVSSQDDSECPFFPSCSVYMAVSVRKQGIILGLINGLDRLIRCSGSQDNRFVLTENHKMIDFP
jgi:putative component of membrane protein insertase Oxa1/YidC/SpoIIIJ protein YidD